MSMIDRPVIVSELSIRLTDITAAPSRRSIVWR
jgi:hypothetical protein